MTTSWTMVRVPAELANRLERLAIHADHAHQTGRLRLPNRYANRCPIHFVITMALDRMESHRVRGRRPKRKRVRVAIDAKLSTDEIVANNINV